MTKGFGALGAPYLAGAAALVLLPALATVALAFTDASGVEPARFVGFDGLGDVVGDPRFRRAALGSAGYAVVSAGARIVAVAALALLLARRGPLAGAARAAAFVPSVLPETAVALVWLWLLDPLEGPVAAVVQRLGGQQLPALVEPGPARLAVPLVAATRLGEALVVALAARRALPPTLHEAAAVEGASPWATARRVTLPLMAPVLGLLALADLVAALGGGLGPALVLTGGGPAGATLYLPQYAREEGFATLSFGVAAAVGALTLAASLVLALLAAVPLARAWQRLR